MPKNEKPRFLVNFDDMKSQKNRVMSGPEIRLTVKDKQKDSIVKWLKCQK